MQVKFFEILWDSDGVDGLPTNVVLNVPEGIDVAMEGADILSDNYGFCVDSFQYTTIKGA